MSSVVVVGEVDGTEVKDVSQQVAAVAAGMGACCRNYKG